jgi:hypothetical protein
MMNVYLSSSSLLALFVHEIEEVLGAPLAQEANQEGIEGHQQ